MYFARTLLVPVLLISGLVEVASAQHKYVFPQFVFGGGWASTLMVQASATPTTCTFSAQGRFLTMRNPLGNDLSSTSITLTFGRNGWTILKTAPSQGMEASSGMAVLDCSEEVSANTLFSLEVGGSLVSEAVVKSPEEIVSGESLAQFIADHRDGARFGVAVANPSDQPISVVVAVFDSGGQQIGDTTVYLPANDFRAFFVDELLTIPTGHTGQVVIAATGSFYAIGLRFTGLVFTTIPATVTATPDTPEPQQFSFSGTWTGPITSNFPGIPPGTATATISQTGSSLSGTWATVYPDPTFNDSGSFSGTASGMSFSGTLSPSDPNACPYTINATVSENLMSGTYATFNCTFAVSGSISLTKH